MGEINNICQPFMVQVSTHTKHNEKGHLDYIIRLLEMRIEAPKNIFSFVAYIMHFSAY